MSTEAQTVRVKSDGTPVGSMIKRAVIDSCLIGYILLMIVLAVSPNGPDFTSTQSVGRGFAIFLACALLGLVISSLALQRGQKTLGELLFAPPHRRVPTSEPKSWIFTFWGIQTLLATFLTLILGISVTGVSFIQLLDKDSFDHAMRLFRELASPDWAILPRAISKVIESVLIAFIATIIAVPIAFVLSFLSAKNIMAHSTIGYGIYAVLRVLFNVSRSVEPILWAIIFSVWVGIGPFAGMLALMIHSVSSLAKQFSEIVECVEDGPIEGIQSTGAGFLQTIWFAVVPQVVLPYISYTIFRWDINVRMATIIGFVGGGGIGMMLLEYLGQAQWPQVGCIIFVITAVVWMMDALSTYVREAIK